MLDPEHRPPQTEGQIRLVSRREALRRAAALGLSLPALSTLVAACGGGAAQPATGAPPPGGSPASAPAASPATAGQSASAPASPPAVQAGAGPDAAAAQREGRVVLYSPLLQPTASALIAAFNAKHPNIEVESLRVTDIMNRYLSEVRANQPSADLLISSTSAPMIELDRQGLVMEYHSPEEEAYASVAYPLAKPGKWLPWQILVWGPSYRTDIVKTPIRTWADAPRVAREEKLPITTMDATLADPAQHVAYTLRENFGDEAVKWYKELAALKPSLFIGHADAQAQQNAGEVVVVFHMVSKTAFDAIAKGVPVTWVAPPEGVPSDGYVAAVMEKAPHPNAAKLFFDFLLSEPGQRELLKVENAYSARPGMPTPAGVKVSYQDLKLLKWDPEKEVREMPQIIQDWREWFGR